MVTDEELESLCAENNLIQIERTKDGSLRLNPPTGMFTSRANSRISHELERWWDLHRKGFVVDSNSGFYLKDGSMLSPDAAYISPERLKTLGKIPEEGFPHLCPDFVIELLSKSDSLRATKRKMKDWMSNGVVLGWLIDPYRKRVFTYEDASEVREVTGEVIEGTGPVLGFRLKLKDIWERYQ